MNDNTIITSALNDMLIGNDLLYAADTTSAFDANVTKLIIITRLPIHPKIEQNLIHDLTEKLNRQIELIYIEDFRMSLSGYGFVEKDGIILLDPLTATTETVFTSYRRRLVESAGATQFIAGDEEAYQQITSDARSTVAGIVITNYKQEKFSFKQFIKDVIGDGVSHLGLPNTEKSVIFLEKTYPAILTKLTKNNAIKSAGGIYSIKNQNSLHLPNTKPYERYILEQHYLGTHDSLNSWQEYMGQIASAGLPTFQTARPLYYQTPEQSKDRTASPIPQTGNDSIDNLVQEMNQLVNTYSINQSTTNFMAFPEAGNSKAAVAASMLMPLWNQNLISVDKSAPIATFIEIQVIEWLRQLVGFKTSEVLSALNVGGVPATGGVMANTAGLLVARSLALPESRKSGLMGSKKKPFLLIADKTLEHYSHKAAFWWLGLGEDNIIPVKAHGYEFDIADLRKKIAKYNSGNNVVIAVVCLAGDSRTLTIQNIGEIYKETSKSNIWLHVDACQGGIGLFSSKRDELCKDYRLADSISMDPHKGLAVPYSSSFCLFKDQDVLQTISKSTDITIAKGSYDLGQITPFLGSRPFDSLKLWALFKFHGLKELAKHVDYRIDLAQQWAACLNSSQSFIALNDPKLTALSFSIDPHKLAIGDITPKELGELNKALHDRCYKAGWLVIHCFDLIDFEDQLGLSEQVPMRVLGTNFGNILLDKSHFPKLISYLESQLAEILSQRAHAAGNIEIHQEVATTTK